MERGGIFREREEIVGGGALLLKNIIKGELSEGGAYLKIYRIFTFLILFFSE